MLASSSNSARMIARLSLLVLVTAIGASGCADPEIDRAGTWKPTGINDQNLSAMLVNPQDLYGGTAGTTRGDSASRAVTRLLLDRRRALLDTGLSRVAPSSSAPGDSGAIQTPGSSSPSGGAAQ